MVKIVAKMTIAGLKTIPVTLGWLAHDASGICQYTLDGRLNGGAYAAVTITSPSAKTRTFTYPAGTDSRQYRVSSTDCAGNPTTIGEGPPFTLGRYQEANAHITYKGTWHRGSSNGYVGGHDRWASQQGAAATVSFTGRAMAWVAPTSSIRGSANVFVDGSKVGTASLRTAELHQRVLVYVTRFPTSGPHTVRLVSRGLNRIDLDEILIIE